MPRGSAVMVKTKRHSRDVSTADSFSSSRPWTPSLVQFVYSEAVERAFRHQYQCPDFGQPSAQLPSAIRRCRQLTPQIPRLPEIYADYVVTREHLERKRNHIARLKLELAETTVPKGYRFQRMSSSSRRFSNVLTRGRQRKQASPSLKLPPITPRLLDSADSRNS
ncbi:hypothetical protein NP493_537g02037 [Ridgeia piscesae]|uniref:Uncharacterized protein n=1 Tax=Ridgeia piscesae TaxID=27915 RepID=A0AAD9KW24_RIDPI|nr:hypothetical protein NP493_537g02037 [Ridgeia piscesae]